MFMCPGGDSLTTVFFLHQTMNFKVSIFQRVEVCGKVESISIVRSTHEIFSSFIRKLPSGRGAFSFNSHVVLFQFYLLLIFCSSNVKS